MAGNYRMPGVQVDGMDVFAVREAAGVAIERARSGDGPTLLEAMTYRYYGQYEGDTQTYKPPAEVARYRAGDPLLRFRASTAGVLDATVLDQVDRDMTAETETALAAAERAPWPDASVLTADVYTTWKA
jgi:TPP-dependent pyruvate/acetoin dehydrogenase alpha subunit